MRISEISGPMMTPFTTSSQTVPSQGLFGMGYYSSLLKQRAMMSPQLTEEEAEMVEQGPYYGMGEITREELDTIRMTNMIAGPIWVIAGIFGDGFDSRLGSGISAVAGTALIAANGFATVKGDNLGGTNGQRTRYFMGAITVIAALFTISDLYNVFKKRPDSPTFKTKLTKLTKSFAPAH